MPLDHIMLKVQEQPICKATQNPETENWDNSNYPTYNPLLATAHKKVIRGTYYFGRSAEEKDRCRKFEAQRYALAKEPRHIEPSPEEEINAYCKENYREDWNCDLSRQFKPQARNGGDSDEESWKDSFLSAHSSKSETDDDSFRTCKSEKTDTSTTDSFDFESTVAEYLNNLSADKRAAAVQRFSKIMREH